MSKTELVWTSVRLLTKAQGIGFPEFTEYARLEVCNKPMTQEQKAAAWDKLMALMTIDTLDNIVVENLHNGRRAACPAGKKWETFLPAGIEGMFPTEFYEGSDPIAALDALIDETESP